MADILVIDDDHAIRRLLTDVLEIDRHDVRVAEDGIDGLRAFDARRPDFVVLDVMMPGLDGHGVLRAIRDRPGDPVPVLMLTAAADAHCAEQAWAGGVNYYLAKPFTADEVLYLIDGVLHHQIPMDDARRAVQYARRQGYHGFHEPADRQSP
jgi:DNA-binding response OmpR family regulator